jgi:hypothetical protein
MKGPGFERGRGFYRHMGNKGRTEVGQIAIAEKEGFRGLAESLFFSSAWGGI